MAFYETLIQTLPVRNISDRTCFRRITAWLRRQVETGSAGTEIFRDVLLLARESLLPGVRNPNAVFLSLLKKELHYDPKAL
jgi:hypothetical protein